MAEETINAEELQSQADRNLRAEIADKWAEKRDSLLKSKAPAVEDTAESPLPEADKIVTPQVKQEVENELFKLSERQLKQWHDKLSSLYKSESKKAGLTDEEAQSIINDPKTKGIAEGKYVDLTEQGEQALRKLQQQQNTFGHQLQMQRAFDDLKTDLQTSQVGAKARKYGQTQMLADDIKRKADAFNTRHKTISDNIKSAIKEDKPLSADFGITVQRAMKVQEASRAQEELNAIDKELDKAIDEQYSKAKAQVTEDNIKAESNQGAFTPSVAMGMQKGFNEAKNLNLEKIARASAEAVSKGEKITDKQKEQIYDLALSKAYAKQKGTTSGNAEHIARKVLLDNTFANLMKAGVAKTTGNYLLNQAEQERHAEYGAKHKVADVVGTVGSFVTDLGAMGVGGVARSASAKVGSWLIEMGAKRLVARSGGQIAMGTAMRMASNNVIVPIAGAITGGATNLGMWEGLSDATNQLSTSKDYSFGQTLGAMGRGAILGIATGGTGYLFGNVTNKAVSALESTGAKVGAKVAGGLASWGAETTIFATPEMIANPDKAWDIWLDNSAMMAGFKVHGLLHSAPQHLASLIPHKGKNLTASQIAENNKSFTQKVRDMVSTHPNECEFSADEERELIENGYGSLYYLASADKVAEDGKFHLDNYSLLGKLMDDPNVSFSAKARAYFMVSGRKLAMPTIVGVEAKSADGKHVVEAYGTDGVLIMRKSFDDAKQAHRCEAETASQSTINNAEIAEAFAKNNGKDVESIRKSVEEDTGKDVGKVLATDFDKRTENDHLAYEDYMRKLMEVKPEEVKLEIEPVKPEEVKPVEKSIEEQKRAEEEHPSEASEEGKTENVVAHEREDSEQKVSEELLSEERPKETEPTAVESDESEVQTTNERFNAEITRYRNGEMNNIESFENPKGIKENLEKNLSEVATETAKELGVKIKLVTWDTLGERDANVKGWYDPKTDEAVIVLDNNADADDIRSTVYHETVGHKGLRGVFGNEFDNFLQNVYDNVGEDTRRAIAKIGIENGVDAHRATEEYLATLAEDGKFKEMNPTAWEKIKHFFKGMLARFGLHEISNNELRYSLWRSYQHHLSGSKPTLMERAMDIAMQHRFKIGNYAPREQRLYRTGDKHHPVKRQIAREYGEDMRKSSYQAKEELQDRMASLDWYMRKASGLKHVEEVPDYLNAYIGQNTVGSATEDAQMRYERDFVKPITKTIEGLVAKIGGKYDDAYAKIIDYLMCKHGVERNAVMETRGAEKRATEEYEKLQRQLPELEQRMKLADYELSKNPNDPDLQLALKEAKDKHNDCEQAILDAQNDWDAFIEKHHSGYARAKEVYDKLQNDIPLLDAEIAQLQVQLQQNPNDTAKKEQYDERVQQRDSLRALKDEADNDWDRFVTRYCQDYSGISTLMATADEGRISVYEATERANRLVADFERAMGQDDIDALWDAIKEATTETVRKQYEGGLISEDDMNRILSTYEYYIPLQGFREDTAEDVYAYLGQNYGKSNKILRKAEDRVTIADDPIATIFKNGLDGIQYANKNATVKRRLLDFATQFPTDLVSIAPVYVQYNATTKQWEMAKPPQMTATDTPEMIEEKMRQWQSDMDDLVSNDPQNYARVSESPQIRYVIDKKMLGEHQIIAYRDGTPVLMTVNGNPRMAQAVNGANNPNAKVIQRVMDAVGRTNRWLSFMYTGMNGGFVVSNLVRDTIYSNSIVWVKESPKYALKYNANYASAKSVSWMEREYRLGKLHPDSYINKMFIEFKQNGGETGYTEQFDIEHSKQNIKRMIKGRKTLGEMFAWLGDISAGIENRARFAAYLTSREMGRDIGRSAWDAHEISVNFNTKGAQGMYVGMTGQTAVGNIAGTASYLGKTFQVFFNAALQGTTNFVKAGHRNKIKGATMSALLMGLGWAMTAWNKAQDEEDDDDNKYFDQPSFLRRKNIIFRGKGKTWVTIALPVEYTLFYGLGEMIGSSMYNQEELRVVDVLKQFSSVAPVDVLAETNFTKVSEFDTDDMQGIAKAFLPSAVRPIRDVSNNETWYGGQIWKETPYNELAPQYTKAYKTANPYLVKWAEKINEMTGGNKYRKGSFDDFNNPAAIEYLLNQYASAIWKPVNQCINLYKVSEGEKEFNWKYVPLANRVIKSADERRVNANLNEKFDAIRDKYEQVWYDFNNTRRDRLMSHDERMAHLNEMMQNEGEWLRLKGLMKAYDKLSTRRSQMSKAGEQEAVQRITERMNEIKQMVVDRVEATEVKQ